MTLLPNSQHHQHLFIPEERSSLAFVPRHIAIIMDGNRRWVQKQQRKIVDPLAGHWEGARNLFRIVQAAIELGVGQLTLFGFSTENWSRPPREVERLLWVIGKALVVYQENLINFGVKLQLIGDMSRFPKKLQERLQSVVAATAGGEAIQMVLALNYGGRNEIVRATRKIVEAALSGEIESTMIDESLMERYLDTARMPDPDLLIRTSGEERISNFLIWQSAYTEFYMTPVLWPEFSPQDLLEACQHYQTRKRRMGK